MPLPPIPPHRCWGKLRHQKPGDRQSEVIAWLPLEDHCADVAACAVVLLGLRQEGFTPTILNRRLAHLGGQDTLDEIQVARLGVLAGLHDVGKCNRGFQAKANPARRREWAGHVGEVVPLILDSADPSQNQALFQRTLDWPTLQSWCADLPELLLAAVSHHGRPAEEKDHATVWRPAHGCDPMAALIQVRNSLQALLPQVWEAGRLLPASAPFIHAFCGLVQLADWLASDDDLFTYASGEGRPDRWLTVDRALREVGLDADWPHQALTRPPVFSDLWPDRPPRPMQRAVAGLDLPTAAGSLVLIEDETGAGKTEAAFLHFARLFAAGLVDGLYFALPTRSAATQLFERIRLMRDTLFPVDARPVCILAVPGYLKADDQEGRLLAPFEVSWPDHDVDRHRFWAAEHPKRYLAGAVVVGTIDQVLLSTLAVNHSHLRATCLLRHLLVVDEVHASDAYMTVLLLEMLTHHQRSGGHALLLSATLGTELAHQLLTGSNRVSVPLELARKRDYPLLSQAGTVVRPESAKNRKPPIRIELHPLIPDSTAGNEREQEFAGRIAALGLEAADQGARVLILRNTVRGAVAVQRALLRQRPDRRNLWMVEKVPAIHHARFARPDREHLDHAIQEVFGKGVDRRGGLVACATQTVQQSLDLDADLLITDLCPMDVLLQRIGRLHRHHDTPRPEGFRRPRCLLLTPEASTDDWLDVQGRSRLRHGLGTVYPDLAILAATLAELRQRQDGDAIVLNIPRDNRALVEAAIHVEALQPWRTDDAWRLHANSVTGTGIQHRLQAISALVPWERPFLDPGVRFPGGELDLLITTRLGEGDRRITWEGSRESPFGKTLHELTVPAWLLHGLDEDPSPCVRQDGQRLTITYSGRHFIYDHLGLQRQEESSEDDHADA